MFRDRLKNRMRKMAIKAFGIDSTPKTATQMLEGAPTQTISILL